MPAHLRSTIAHFTTDMWEGYLNAIEDFIAAHPEVTARLVIDRFHVAQQYRDDFDDLRKQEFKRMKKELPQEIYDQDCKGTLWLLRKNHKDLEEQEPGAPWARLRRLFLHAPTLHQAYTFREELTALFNQVQTHAQGERRLTQWIHKVEQSALDCYDRFLKTLRTHWNPILNYFDDRINSGFVEGLNNKIKTIKRRCYGIRKIATLFQRIWLDLQGLERFFLSTP
ncbi:MAG: transposase [Anaerolineae bacterium]|nr:transposase [Anaerolineae bacterium]